MGLRKSEVTTRPRVHGEESPFSRGQLLAIPTKRPDGDDSQCPTLDRRPIAVGQIHDAPNGCSLVKIYTNGARLQRRRNRQHWSRRPGLRPVVPPGAAKFNLEGTRRAQRNLQKISRRRRRRLIDACLRRRLRPPIRRNAVGIDWRNEYTC
jgi:hypothetical protein